MADTKPAVKATKPAATKPAAKKQPAVEAKEEVTLKDLAKKLGYASEKSLRAKIRRINGGPVVGRGGRYTWPSFNDKGLQELMKKLQEKKGTDAA
jgi:hypothetical protein